MPSPRWQYTIQCGLRVSYYNNVFDSSKENSENFSVDSIVWGTLCVKPLNISITTGDKIKTYDGTICRNEMIESVEGKRDTDRIVYSWNHEFTDVLYDENGKVIIPESYNGLPVTGKPL